MLKLLEICRKVIGKVGLGGCCLGLGHRAGASDAGVVVARAVGGGVEDVRFPVI